MPRLLPADAQVRASRTCTHAHTHTHTHAHTRARVCARAQMHAYTLAPTQLPAGALLLARGFPHDALIPAPPPKPLLPSQLVGGARAGARKGPAASLDTPLTPEAADTAAASFVQASHGAGSFACPADAGMI